MSSSMALHHSIARSENGRVRLVEEAGLGPVTQEEAVFRRASVVLMCASYRNQALHVFTRPALVAVAMTTAPSGIKGACKLYYGIRYILYHTEYRTVCFFVWAQYLQTMSSVASVSCKSFWQTSSSSCLATQRR